MSPLSFRCLPARRGRLTTYLRNPTRSLSLRRQPTPFESRRSRLAARSSRSNRLHGETKDPDMRETNTMRSLGMKSGISGTMALLLLANLPAVGRAAVQGSDKGGYTGTDATAFSFV